MEGESDHDSLTRRLLIGAAASFVESASILVRATARWVDAAAHREEIDNEHRSKKED